MPARLICHMVLCCVFDPSSSFIPDPLDRMNPFLVNPCRQQFLFFRKIIFSSVFTVVSILIIFLHSYFWVHFLQVSNEILQVIEY